jgi:hypothetical protein
MCKWKRQVNSKFSGNECAHPKNQNAYGDQATWITKAKRQDMPHLESDFVEFM